MRFKYFISEARRNPDKNPKISLVQALEPYKDKPDYFISFTDGFRSRSQRDYEDTKSPPLPKLGLNPKTKYDTPAGIYAYPLKEMWKAVKDDNIPFAGDRPFIQLFRCSHPKVQELSEITESQLKQTEQKLWELYGDKLSKTKHFIVSDIDQLIEKHKEKMKEICKIALKNLYSTNKNIWQDFYVTFNFLANGDTELLISFEDLQYDQEKLKAFLIDLIKGLEKITQNKLKFNIKNIKTYNHNDVDYNFTITRVITNKNNINEAWFAFVNDCYRSARIKTPGGKFWNLTRLTADLMTSEKYRSVGYNHSKMNKLGNSNTWTWAHVLRALGYVGFTDRTGQGYIHPSEPTQAVFLSKQYIKEVDTILNKRYIKKEHMDPAGKNKTPENLKETWVVNFTKNYINRFQHLYELAMSNEKADYEEFNNVMQELYDDSKHYTAGDFNGGFNNPTPIILKLKDIFTPTYVEMLVQYNNYSGANIWKWGMHFSKKSGYGGPIGATLLLAVLNLLEDGSLEESLDLTQKWELYRAMYENTKDKEYKAYQKGDTKNDIIDRFIKTGKEKMNFFDGYDQEKMKKLVQDIEKILDKDSGVSLFLAGDDSVPF